MTESSGDGGLEGLQGYMTAIQVLSVINMVLGVITFGFGIPTVILANFLPAYPFTSGSGIYTGPLVILTGVFGILFLKEAVASPPDKLRCYNITYRVFLTIGLDVGAVHFGYGIWSLVVCSQGPNVAGCGGANWPANYLLAAVNMTMGLSILVVSIVSYVISWKPLKRTWAMTKTKTDVETIKA